MGDTNTTFSITVEFTGGLELLFANQKKIETQVPLEDASGNSPDITWLVKHLCDHEMKDSRKDMFLSHDSVRPGILVLINDADWELEGEANYQLQKGDNIMFVSTLHGG